MAAPHGTRPPAELAGHPLLYFSFPNLSPLDTEWGGSTLAVEAEKHEPDLIVLEPFHGWRKARKTTSTPELSPA